jgi:hypothetical protein
VNACLKTVCFQQAV